MARTKRGRDLDDIAQRVTTRARLPAYLERLPTELWLEVCRPVLLLLGAVTRLDRFAQIFAYLPWESLFSLFKVNKALRQVLLDESLKDLWQRQFQEGEYPSCPDHLSGPAFADLLLGNNCRVRRRPCLAWHTSPIDT